MFDKRNIKSICSILWAMAFMFSFVQPVYAAPVMRLTLSPSIENAMMVKPVIDQTVANPGHDAGSFTACSAVTGMSQSECEALVALYTGTSGSSWTNHADWLATNTPCSWYGVTCDSGHVTGLSLVGNQLSGSLPTQLGNLTNLQTLNISNNQLSGSIPTQLGGLTNLQSLNFDVNQLSGSIPTELGNLSNLEDLSLNTNQLSGTIPAVLGSLTNLTQLDLEDNQLSGTIPPELGSLTKLNCIWLDENQLTGGIPAQLGGMTLLTGLNLNANQLSGSIPSQLGNLSNLENLSLNNNQLSGSIPTQLGSLTHLTNLYLNNNQLSGSIPTELGSLTQLIYLRLQNNQLSGSIPTQLGGLTHLQSINFDVNQLSGSIPTELGNLSNLEDLSLNTNQLSGTIPAVLGSLINLTQLDLEDNQLSGTIPPELGNLTHLNCIWLDENQLTGSIPAQLGGMTLLTGLNLNANQLSGSIPAVLGSLSNLEYLALDNNQLSGSIPTQLGNLTHLTNLYLENNHLSGSIPTQLGSLIHLTYLRLQHNQLSGSIPTELGSLTALQYLDLSINQLSGSLPLSLKNLTKLDTFYFDSTNLCEPGDPTFQTWLNGITSLAGTSICPPNVASSVRTSANPSRAASVNFTVAFDEAVTGVDKTDFSLTTTGVTGAAVSSVSGSGKTYTVVASTGSGSGTLRLNVVDNDTIISATSGIPLGGTGAGNGSFTSGQVYTIDKTVPVVSAVVRTNATPSSEASANYTVSFSEAVTGVDKTDFNLTTTGVSGASVSSVSGSGTTYTVAVATGSGDGTLRLNVIDNDSIVDTAGNPLGGSGTGNGNFTSGETYTITKTVPGAATLVSPLASVTTGKPTFVWSKVSAATLYRLWIKNSGGTWVVQSLYSGTNICGATQCGATITTPLVNGTYTWNIQTLTATQNGAWSGHSFTVAIPTPGLSTLVSPKGTIHLAKPTFIWSKDPVATLYRLWVKDSGGTWVFQNLYAGTNICGVTNCAMVSPSTLANGSYTWYIQTLTNTQNGPWSAQTFVVSVADVVPVPSGSDTGVK